MTKKIIQQQQKSNEKKIILGKVRLTCETYN
jgi:hypothetical protein